MIDVVNFVLCTIISMGIPFHLSYGTETFFFPRKPQVNMDYIPLQNLAVTVNKGEMQV